MNANSAGCEQTEHVVKEKKIQIFFNGLYASVRSLGSKKTKLEILTDENKLKISIVNKNWWADSGDWNITI